MSVSCIKGSRRDRPALLALKRCMLQAKTENAIFRFQLPQRVIFMSFFIVFYSTQIWMISSRNIFGYPSQAANKHSVITSSPVGCSSFSVLYFSVSLFNVSVQNSAWGPVTTHEQVKQGLWLPFRVLKAQCPFPGEFFIELCRCVDSFQAIFCCANLVNFEQINLIYCWLYLLYFSLSELTTESISVYQRLWVSFGK